MSALPSTAFWYLRHGQTDWNAQNLAQGNIDIPLNAAGIAQAHNAAELLRNRGIGAIVSSPLGRARVTAEAAARVLDLPVAIDDGLHECAFGENEGKPMLAQWFDDWIAGSYTPKGAETFIELRDRAAKAVTRAVTQPTLVLIVGHGAVFRALRAEMGLEPNVRLPNATPQLCEPPIGGQGPWSLTAATQL